MRRRTTLVLVLTAVLMYYVVLFVPERLHLQDAMSVFKSFTDVLQEMDVTASVATSEEANSSMSVGSAEANLTEPSSGNETTQHPGTMANKSTFSPLNDHTLPWDFTIHRPWLDASAENPPAMLLLTNSGFNQQNQTKGLMEYRGVRLLELMDGIINHPWFHPTAWEDIESGTLILSNITRYYVFLDHDTCGEGNYPRYGHGRIVNMDKNFSRAGVDYNPKDIFRRNTIRYQLFRHALPNVKFLVFDCHGNGPLPYLHRYRRSFGLQRLIFVPLSASVSKSMPLDQGLPPPACRKFNLSRREEDNIYSCKEEESRSILVSFAGTLSRSSARKDLYSIRDGKSVVVGTHNTVRTVTNVSDFGESYEQLIKQSLFSAAPRGDNLFSYRFAEVMSLASIPVIYADDWLLPFGLPLINWTEAAVIIPEAKANQSAEILSNISPDQRCRMRQRTLEIFNTYMKTGRGTIRGLVENLELLLSSPNNSQTTVASSF